MTSGERCRLSCRERLARISHDSLRWTVRRGEAGCRAPRTIAVAGWEAAGAGIASVEGRPTLSRGVFGRGRDASRLGGARARRGATGAAVAGADALGAAVDLDGVGVREQSRVGAPARGGDPDLPRCHAHARADLEEPKPERLTLGAGHRRPHQR